MDLQALSDTKLQDANGETRRLGEYWEDKPVVLVFLRHFGCLLCREHAAELRSHYDEIQALGGDVVAVGTGDLRYAADFIQQEDIPFPVLVDDDAAAAHAASVPRVNPVRLLFDPRSLRGAWQAHRAGYKVRKPGRRTNQLGATFVVGQGERVRYAHVDEHTADHAAVDDVLAALSA